MLNSRDTFENVIATVVDIASIMVAYAIGIHQSNFILGLFYGMFDALVVVWMRKPLAKAMKSAFKLRDAHPWKRDVYVSDA